MTRAQPGAAQTAERLAALGFEPMVAPLLAIRSLPCPPPDLAGVAALAFTSRNGIDAFAALTRERGLPVFAVGDATAERARQAGFADVRSASGAIGDLARLLAEAAPGLVLAPGAKEPAGDLSALLRGRVGVRRLPVYEAVETGAEAPPDWDAALVHSPRAGRALAGSGPVAGRTVVVISEAAAAALGPQPEAEVRIAARPDEAAMLEALGKPPPRV